MPPETVRDLAESHVDRLADLDPFLATHLGLDTGADRLPDLSPHGQQQVADACRQTLAALDRLETAGAGAGAGAAGTDAERCCARLLRERLTATLALHDAGEGLRELGVLFSPPQRVRQIFTMMPTASAADWEAIEARLRAVPQALQGYRESLAEGRARGLFAGPRQVEAVTGQFRQWLDGGDGSTRSWFTEFAAGAPSGGSESLRRAAVAAGRAFGELGGWLAEEYLPAARVGGTDPVGPERYARFARYWTGSDLDLAEVHAWGWQEYARLDAGLRAEAERVLPGAGPRAAMEHLDRHGEAVEGAPEVRGRLQQMLDEAIEALDGVHFDLDPRLRRVEAMLAPSGTAAAPYYTPPSLDFTRPGRTWLPVMDRTRFPLWDLVSTWYHEGVPGHHLQLAQWILLAPQLSRFQISVGAVSANLEGWALYAERLMDEFGFLADPGPRMGYLDAQQLRAVRVIIDIGMHLELPIPSDQGVAEPFAPGRRWTPELAREFFGRNSGRPAEFLDSELLRYLGMPGQAIGYKLGERAWLAGRDAARSAAAAEGREFDLRRWHMAALSQGSLGLDDLVSELAAIRWQE